MYIIFYNIIFLRFGLIFAAAAAPAAAAVAVAVAAAIVIPVKRIYIATNLFDNLFKDPVRMRF